ncbi:MULTISPECIES: hypothetical protein [unclassified Streptomyces]|uniref:hypothetical protein n=1 Tax=unclassified Streptomyces TaxID=2593676 RepID=UPI0036E26CC9
MLRRTSTGAGIAAVAVVTALAVSGCGSGGGNEAKKAPPASASASATGTPGTAASMSAEPGASGSPTASSVVGGDSTQGVEGVWLATQGSTKVQLVLGKGKAGLTSSHLCGGTYTDRDGLGLTLTCMDGDKERTSGRGELTGDGKTLTVRWTGGPTDTFSRTGLPSS